MKRIKVINEEEHKIIEIKKNVNKWFFESIKFVTVALKRVFKDDERFHTNHICIEDGNAIATDGCRLHLWSKCPFDEGYYRVIKNTKSELILLPIEDENKGWYPEWKDLIPSREPNNEFDLLFNLEESAKVIGLVNKAISKERIIDYRFLLDICEVTDGDYYVSIFNNEDGITNELIVIRDKANNELLALIMPIKI